MNKTFIIASLKNSWCNSIQLAEQHILHAKMSGASAVLLDVSSDMVSREIFSHLKGYADNFNLACVMSAGSKEKFEWMQEEQVKIHFIDKETLQKPVLCATMLQTGIPALLSLEGWAGGELPLGDDFKNVKYLVHVNNKNDLPQRFEDNIVGIIDSSEDNSNILESVSRGAKIVLKEFYLDKELAQNETMSSNELYNTRMLLNRFEMNNAL